MKIGQVQALVFPEGAAPPQTPPKGIAAGASGPGDAIGATSRLQLKIMRQGERKVDIAYSGVSGRCKWRRQYRAGWPAHRAKLFMTDMYLDVLKGPENYGESGLPIDCNLGSKVELRLSKYTQTFSVALNMSKEYKISNARSVLCRKKE